MACTHLSKVKSIICNFSTDFDLYIILSVVMNFTPYTQTLDYFATKVQDGCELVEVCGNQRTKKLIILKQPVTLKKLQIPIFYKLFSSGLNLDTYFDHPEYLEELEALVRKLRCVRAQIVANPVKKRERFPQFKGTMHTYLLDLLKKDITDEDKYLAFLDSKVRNQVKRAYKQQLEFFQLEVEKGIVDYVKLRQQSRLENGLSPLEEGLLERQLRGLSSSARIFLVKKDGQALCGQIVQKGDNIFTLVGVCTSRMAYEKKLNVNELMQQKIVNCAMNERVRFVDWVGANPNSKDKKLNAIDKFKRKWGGELTELPCLLKG